MLPLRVSVFFALAALLAGSLSLTAGFASYLRSAWYRDACARRLSLKLGLPATIGAVTPRSLSSREFDDVVVYFPDGRQPAFACAQAVLMATPQPDDPNAYGLDLRGGQCEISRNTWLRKDSREVLAAGLRPGLLADGPRQVDFSQMDLRLEYAGVLSDLNDASGHVTFDNAGHGQASLVCQQFNDYTPSEPVYLEVRFSSEGGGIQFDHLGLQAPCLPLAEARLGRLLGATPASGVFDGRVDYREVAGTRYVDVRGRCFDLDLAELTLPQLVRPWRGRLPEVELEELQLVDRRLDRLRFRGVVTDLHLDDVLAPWGLGEIGGLLRLDIGAADITPAGIGRLVASGRCERLSLDALTDALGYGRMTGTLSVRIDDLAIVDNRLVSLDATVQIEDADPAKPNIVEGRLLREVLGRALRLPIPPVLPEKIEYTRLGLRVDVKDERLRVYGSHGEDNKTILTVRLWGRAFPLVGEPARDFDLAPLLDMLRAKLKDASPATQPVSSHKSDRSLGASAAEPR